MIEENADLERQSAEALLVVARSEFLDAFADVEAEVAAMLHHAGKLKNGSPFHARIDAFRMLEGTSKIAKANYPKRDKLADRMASHLSLRADIVHSRMTVCIVDGVVSARFVNVQNRHEGNPPCRLLTVDQIQKISRELVDILKELRVLNVNPASSPLPPSRA